MKKIIFASILFICALNVVHSSTLPQKFLHTSLQNYANENDVKASAIGSYVRDFGVQPSPSAVIVRCHTPYSWSIGHACVSINGSLYMVSWFQNTENGMHNPSYISSSSPDCNCN